MWGPKSVREKCEVCLSRFISKPWPSAPRALPARATCGPGDATDTHVRTSAGRPPCAIPPAGRGCRPAASSSHCPMLAFTLTGCLHSTGPLSHCPRRDTGLIHRPLRISHRALPVAANTPPYSYRVLLTVVFYTRK